MLRSVIGALVGNELDKRNGRGGVGGALLGAVAARAVTRMGPLGMLLGGAYVAKKAYDRRRGSRVTS